MTWQDRTYLPDLPAAYQAPNRAHNLRTYFTPDGIRAIPRTGDVAAWEWGLRLTGYGYEGAIQPVTPATLSAERDRVEYRRGGLTESYVNDERGLEQGFTLYAPPSVGTRRDGSPLTLTSPRRSGSSTFLSHQGRGGNVPLVLELAVTGDLSPSLTEDGRAVELTTEGGVAVLRYGSLYVEDAVGRRLPSYLAVAASGIAVLVDDRSAIYPIVVDPLVTSPSWTAESDQAAAFFGVSVGTAGDVNGDGYSDVIVGAYAYDNGQTTEGRAFVYHGSLIGLTTGSANWTAESDQAGARFGHSVGTAGDVNRDGYSDVIVGAYWYDNGESDEGSAFVFHGSSTGLTAGTADWTAESDQAYAAFGLSVGTAGDVNGDGYSDVIVGAPLYNNGQANEGRAFVYRGSATGLSATAGWTAESDQAGAYFGISVGTAGGVNGDGYSDVIVGAYSYDNEESDEGRAFVYHGSSTGLTTGSADWTAEGDQAGAVVGLSVGTAGDLNGDGYSDVIVGASGYDNGETDEGRAFVYHGSSTGLTTGSADWTAEGDQAGAGFGASVGTAGDVNRDGYSDVIVGAGGYDNGETDEGRAFVYHGLAPAVEPVPSLTQWGLITMAAVMATILLWQRKRPISRGRS